VSVTWWFLPLYPLTEPLSGAIAYEVLYFLALCYQNWTPFLVFHSSCCGQPSWNRFFPGCVSLLPAGESKNICSYSQLLTCHSYWTEQDTLNNKNCTICPDVHPFALSKSNQLNVQNYGLELHSQGMDSIKLSGILWFIQLYYYSQGDQRNGVIIDKTCSIHEANTCTYYECIPCQFTLLTGLCC